MKRAKKEHVRRWVVAGYGAIILVVAVTIIYVAGLLSQTIGDNGGQNPAHQKAAIVTNTLLELYEYETNVLSGIASGDVGRLPQLFEQMYGQVHARLDSLRGQAGDSATLARTGEIESLLLQKQENTYRLLGTRVELEQLYAKSLAQEMRRKRDKIKLTGTQTFQENQTTDTLIVQRQQKGFFRRLAEVFTPAKTDTATRKNTTQRQQVDSLAKEYDPNQAVSEALLKLQSSILGKRDAVNAKLVAQSSELLRNNRILTERINQILFDIKEEETQAALAQDLQRQAFMNKSLKELALIAVAALSVILFFFSLIMKEESKARRLRKQLESAKKRTEDLLLSREKLMLMISHDVRAPLSSILSSADLLGRSALTCEQAGYVGNLSASAGHILALVNDLLDFHRLESGQMEIHPQPVNLVGLFEEIHAGFKPLSDAKGLKLRLDTSFGKGPAYYMGDPVRIRQAAGNLLSNAIKFTPKGNIFLRVWMETGTPEGFGLLCISVKDEGPGIAGEEQEKIFREFTRLEGSGTTEGFGLGLSISNKLVSLMEGSISLESRPGEGCDFTVRLPLRQAAEPVAEEGAQPGFIAGRNLNCLAIDDDALQLKYAEALLKRYNMNVIPCSDSNEVAGLLQVAAFDLVLTDIQMPGLDGYALLRLIRASGMHRTAAVPVVALSASLAEKEEHYRESGFAGFLCKPFTAGALASLLGKLFPSLPVEAAGEVAEAAPLNFPALTSFAGNEEEAGAILRTFATEAGKNVELLRKASKAGDRALAAKVSHKQIPTLAMLEAHATVRQLQLLETNGQQMAEAAWKEVVYACIESITAITGQLKCVE